MNAVRIVAVDHLRLIIDVEFIDVGRVIGLGVWYGPSEIDSSVADCCCEIESPAFFTTVEKSAYLVLVILIISRPSRILNLCDMSVLCAICRKFDGSSIGSDVRYDALHEF